MSGEQIVTLCVGLANAVLAILVAIFSYTLFNKKEKIYLKKQETIYRALALCDKYFSWLNYSTDGKKDPDPTRNLEDTTLSITEEARLVYNNLVCSCESEVLINTFLTLFFVGEEFKLDTYNSFRNMCRKELGLKELEGLSKERIFLSSISTNDLTAHSQSKIN